MPRTLFTRENAREFSLKANQIRWSREREARSESQVPSPPVASPDDYVARSLSRVRAQIEMLNEKLESTIKDPEASAGDLDRIAAAIERLRKLEQTLAGRPGPGNLKPTAPKPSRLPVSVEPVELPNSTQVAPDNHPNA